MRSPCSGRASSVTCGLLLGACSVLWSPTPALAHTSLVGSTPSSSAVVSTPLDAVTLVFDQPVSPRLARVVVSGPDGADVADGPARVSGGTVTRAVGAPPPAGDYRLAYRVLAEDGHPITGQVRFRVTSSAVPTGAVTTAVPQQQVQPASAPASQTASQTYLVPALVAGLVGAGVVLVLGAVRAGRRAGAGR